MAVEPVNLFIAANQAKTEANDLLQTTRASGISVEAIKKENAELKERNTMLEQSLVQAVNERNEAISSASGGNKDLENAHQEIQQLLALIQQLKGEIHTILGLKEPDPVPDAEVVTPVEQHESAHQEEPVTEANS